MSEQEQRVFAVHVTIGDTVHNRRWTAPKICEALAQWSDPKDRSYRLIKKIEIVPEGPSHAAR